MFSSDTGVMPWRRARLYTNIGVMLTAGLGAVGMAMTLVTTLALVFIGAFELEPAAIVAAYLVPTTLVTGVFCAWMCLRKERNKEDAARSCLTAGLIGGILNALLGYLVIMVSSVAMNPYWYTDVGRLDSFVVGAVIATLMGLIVGSPIGLIFSLILLRPIKFGCTHERSHDSVERTGMVCGSWFALIGAICTSLLLVASLCGTVDDISGTVIALAWCVFSAGLGGGVYGLSKIRSARRKRWLEQVRSGEIQKWTILPLNAQFEEMAKGLRPFIASEDEAAMGILARTKRAQGQGAYRRADQLVPVATVTKAYSPTP